MKLRAFSRRCAREILRDPLTLFFGLGFPVVLLLLLSAIQANIPVDLFRIAHLAPGICIFGLSFLTLFSATLIARDKETSFLLRLYATPLKPRDFILGYLLPLIPIALGQAGICYVAAICLGLPVSANILLAMVLLLPTGILYIALGLLFGSICNVRQVGGLCGALLTNLSAWLSGVWFDLELVGGAFQKIAYCLPFVHGVRLERAAIAGDLSGCFGSFLVVCAYALGALVCAISLFLRQIRQ